MVSDSPLRVSRRAVLLGSAGALMLAACGDGGDASDSLDLQEISEGDLQLVAPIPPADYLTTGAMQRIPLYVRDFEGAPLDDDPAEIEVRVVYDGEIEEGASTVGQGEPVGDPVTVARRSDGIPLAYYPLQITFARTGLYSLVATARDQEITTPVQVFDPESVPVPQVGAPMRPEQTATVADPRNVDPVCTRDPACPFHDRTLTDALAAGTATALLIGTPAYCQTGICGPVLDLLIEESATTTGVGYVHAEPYLRPTPEDPAENGVAPVVETYGLSFEPSLFVADAAGTIVARLDIIYDQSELRDALALAQA